MTALTSTERSRARRARLAAAQTIPSAVRPKLSREQTVERSVADELDRSDPVVKLLAHVVALSHVDADGNRPTADRLYLAARAAALMDKVHAIREPMVAAKARRKTTRADELVVPGQVDSRSYRVEVKDSEGVRLAYRALDVVLAAINGGTANPRDLRAGLRACQVITAATRLTFTDTGWDAFFTELAETQYVGLPEHSDVSVTTLLDDDYV